MSRVLVVFSLVASGLMPGCLSQWNTRLPRPNRESPEFQRRESQMQDPFPDDSIGPEMGFRPPGYEVPRTDPLRTRQHYNSTILKQRFAPPPGPQVGPGAQYPGAVHVD